MNRRRTLCTAFIAAVIVWTLACVANAQVLRADAANSSESPVETAALSGDSEGK